MHHLGFDISTKTMRMSWPSQKRADLRKIIDEEWNNTVKPIFSPRQIARLLGLVRNGCQVFPWGDVLSIRLTQVLSDAVRLAGSAAVLHKRWWNRRAVRVPRSARTDVSLLRQMLDDSSI